MHSAELWLRAKLLLGVSVFYKQIFAECFVKLPTVKSTLSSYDCSSLSEKDFCRCEHDDVNYLTQVLRMTSFFIGRLVRTTIRPRVNMHKIIRIFLLKIWSFSHLVWVCLFHLFWCCINKKKLFSIIMIKQSMQRKLIKSNKCNFTLYMYYLCGK